MHAQFTDRPALPSHFAGIYDTTDVSELYPFTEGIFRIDIPQVVSRDIIVLVTDTTVYVPLFDLFSFLETQTIASNNNKRIETQFPNDQDIVIDIDRNLITIDGREISLKPDDYIYFSNEIFLDSRYFPRYFSSSLIVNVNTLVITFQSKLTFPVEDRIRRAQRYATLQTYAPVAQRIDQHLERSLHMFNGAMLDWGAGFQSQLDQWSYRATLGTELLGGDFFGSVNGFSTAPVQWSVMPWRWRYVENDYPYFHQATVGNYQSAFGRLYSARGVTVSNIPPFQRPSFGDYSYSGTALPFSDVELYVNDRFVQFVTADSTGHYLFTIPMPYGGAMLRIEAHSRQGRTTVHRDRIDIDNSFLTPGLMEYTASAGELVPLWNQKAGQALARMGITEDLTMGVGYSGIFTEDVLQSSLLAQVAFRLLTRTNWLIEHVHNTYSRLQVRYFDPTGVYVQWSNAIGYNNRFWNPMQMLNEQRLTLGIPFRLFENGSSINLSGIRVRSRMYENLSVFSFFSYTVGRFSASLSLNGAWFRYSGAFSTPNVTSALWASLTLMPRITLGSRLEHNSALRKFTFLQNALFVNMVNNWYFTVTHSQNLMTGDLSLQLGITLRAPFAVFNTGSQYMDERVSHSVAASGTIGYDSQVNNLLFHNMQWVGRSGVTILPFLDVNGNAQHERDEPLLMSTVSATSNRGAVMQGSDQSLTRFVSLDQYERIQVTLDPSSLSDPSWMPRYKTFEIVTDPNQFKPVLLPVYFAGEALGTVSRQTPSGLIGMRNMKILFTNADSSFRDIVYTFSDGGFSYFGLPPGRYTAMIDTARARRLGLASYPESRTFSITSRPDGDMVGNIDFILKPVGVPGIAGRMDSTTTPIAQQETQVSKDTGLPKNTAAIAGTLETVTPDTTTGRTLQQPVSPDITTLFREPLLAADTTKTRPTVPGTDTGIGQTLPGGRSDSTLAGALVPEKVEIPPEPVKLRELKILAINLQKPGLDTSVTNYLDRIAQTVKTTKNVLVRIEGHSDNFGNFIQNQQRSQERAVRARDYLVRKGVKPGSIVIQAFGSRRPIAPNTTPEGRAQNNRIEVNVTSR